MRFGIVYHKHNIAGKNIVDRFREMSFSPQIPIIELEKEALYSDISIEKYPELKEVEFLFFAYSHKSQKGDPSLCLHVAGNWRGNDLGGDEGKVCMTSSFVIKYLFQKLDENAKKDSGLYEKYKVSMEATHHGPNVSIPSCFIELGSVENEWRDEKAAKVIAETILSLSDVEMSELNAKGWKPTIAVGGGHYCLNFNKIQLNSEYAIGHVIADYGFPVTEQIIKEAEEKTKEQVSEVLVDWKSCGKSEERQKMLDVLERVGLSYERTGNIKK
jgi:D-aminoacyl-tRNA deacylase